jgi:gamma-glutamyltranspeptidase / glutathione hydrolase
MASAAIASSDPRAARAGADVLENGGNAVDAAVAAALVLFVVEPHACGPGGDAFLLVSEPGKEPEGLDGSGAVPAGLTQDALEADGLEFVPVRGARSVTVPGAVGLLEEALRVYGTRSLGDLVGPALSFARDGFAVRRTLADTSARAASEIAKDPVLGPLYAPGGDPLRIDARVSNPRLADLLELIARDGADAFYRGAVAEQLAERVREQGGYLSVDDLHAHRTVPAQLLSTEFRGARVYELPAPTQGPAVIAALDLIEPMGPIEWDRVLEAIIVGLKEAGIDLSSRPAPQPAAAAPRDTTYIAAIDREGRGASLITSVFADFGSHLGVEALGGPIHNRATTFYALRLPPRPGKPPHTTIPSLATRDGACEHVLGLAGGYVQAQVQVQLLIHLLDGGMEPQAAIDAPRMRVLFGGELGLERGHPLAEEFPDAVERQTGPEGYGGAQVASRRDGRVRAGADRRRDGAAIELQ